MILDGKEVSNSIKNDIKRDIESLLLKGIQPGLGVILVGERIESHIYVSMKEKACNELGIFSKVYRLPEETSEQEINDKIQLFNDDDRIHGILVQLPLPKHIDERTVLDYISPKKDVDGLGVLNTGKLMINNNVQIMPCTPRGCIEMLDYYNIPLLSKEITIIGTSNLVGLPLSIMLLHRGATITLCNINTNCIKEKTKDADIVIACCGVPRLVKSDWVKKGSIIIDIGINKIEDNTSKGYTLVGDVDYDNIKDKVEYITPVPGGIGPMTIAILMKQTVDICIELHKSKI